MNVVVNYVQQFSNKMQLTIVEEECSRYYGISLVSACRLGQ